MKELVNESALIEFISEQDSNFDPVDLTRTSPNPFTKLLEDEELVKLLKNLHKAITHHSTTSPQSVLTNHKYIKANEKVTNSMVYLEGEYALENLLLFIIKEFNNYKPLFIKDKNVYFKMQAFFQELEEDYNNFTFKILTHNVNLAKAIIKELTYSFKDLTSVYLSSLVGGYSDPNNNILVNLPKYYSLLILSEDLKLTDFNYIINYLYSRVENNKYVERPERLEKYFLKTSSYYNDYVKFSLKYPLADSKRETLELPNQTLFNKYLIKILEEEIYEEYNKFIQDYFDGTLYFEMLRPQIDIIMHSHLCKYSTSVILESLQYILHKYNRSMVEVSGQGGYTFNESEFLVCLNRTLWTTNNFRNNYSSETPLEWIMELHSEDYVNHLEKLYEELTIRPLDDSPFGENTFLGHINNSAKESKVK